MTMLTMRLGLSGEHWRSPLRLIDSLLPSAPVPRTAEPAQAQRCVARFARAGWLVPVASPGHSASAACPQATTSPPACEQRARPTPLRRLVVHSNPNGLRISGRVADVCAELERLAQLEARHTSVSTALLQH